MSKKKLIILVSLVLLVLVAFFALRFYKTNTEGDEEKSIFSGILQEKTEIENQSTEEVYTPVIPEREYVYEEEMERIGAMHGTKVENTSFTSSSFDYVLNYQKPIKCFANAVMGDKDIYLTRYFKDGKIFTISVIGVSGEESITYTVLRDGNVYVWSPGKETGEVRTYDYLVGLGLKEQDIDYTCDEWDIPDSMYDLPTNIKFEGI